MKVTIFLVLLFLSFGHAQTQGSDRDSLRAIIAQQKGSKAEVDALVHLGRLQSVDSSFKTLSEALIQARKINYRKGEADCLLLLQRVYNRRGNFSQAIQANLDAAAIYEEVNEPVGAASAHGMAQGIYREAGDYRKSLYHAFRSLHIAEKHNVTGHFAYPGHRWATLMLAEIGQTYVLLYELDSALYYTQKAIDQRELFNGSEWEFPIYLLATILNMKGQYKPALAKYRQALALCAPNQIFHDTIQIYSGMSTLFKNMGLTDSTIHYAKIVAKGWDRHSEYKNLLEALQNLAQVYKTTGNKDSALKYAELSYAVKDSIFSAEKNREVQWIAFNARLKEEELKAEEIKYKSRLQLQVLIAGLAMLFTISAILWRNNRQKQKAKAKIEQAYSELKATQVQLVQREKMASLGELTAGIAHEIQNPLNFINNFSEANNELLEEMEQQIGRGNLQEIKTLAGDIKENELKILHHGRRADNIVKNMLEHSRSSRGEKQPTDINALTDEYLKLAYHGFRTKESMFSVIIETHYDPSVEKINIIPQEIGRVLLNLFNNAFYSVQQKKKLLNDNYEPLVQVSTRKHNGKIEVSVKDNGTGIPEKVLSKIYQPFFTTKPTGEGTGLGLSLSYDIVKAHGGELNVQSEEGKGAAFFIQLPFYLDS